MKDVQIIFLFTRLHADLFPLLTSQTHKSSFSCVLSTQLTPCLSNDLCHKSHLQMFSKLSESKLSDDLYTIGEELQINTVK